MIEKAKQLATEWHKGQKRWDGSEYITHPESVAQSCDYETSGDERTITLAWLHDTVEDTSASICDIKAHFDEEMGEMVRLLTRECGVTYFDYIESICDSCVASVICVKIADIQHNLEGLKEGSMKDKYRFALKMLWEAL